MKVFTKIMGDDLEKVSSFMYLESVVEEDGNMGMEIKQQICWIRKTVQEVCSSGSGWNN